MPRRPLILERTHPRDKWRSEFLGFGYARTERTRFCRVPYWSIVLPLAGLSAWLFFSKQPLLKPGPELASWTLSDYFEGRTRKVTLVALLLGSITTVAWISSYYLVNVAMISGGDFRAV